jgi:hypothetical protein
VLSLGGRPLQINVVYKINWVAAIDKFRKLMGAGIIVRDAMWGRFFRHQCVCLLGILLTLQWYKKDYSIR